jgi:hypothetical protein
MVELLLLQEEGAEMAARILTALPALLMLCRAHLLQQPSLLRQVLAVALQLMMPCIQHAFDESRRLAALAAGRPADEAEAAAADEESLEELEPQAWQDYSTFLLMLMHMGELQAISLYTVICAHPTRCPHALRAFYSKCCGQVNLKSASACWWLGKQQLTASTFCCCSWNHC